MKMMRSASILVSLLLALGCALPCLAAAEQEDPHACCDKSDGENPLPEMSRGCAARLVVAGKSIAVERSIQPAAPALRADNVPPCCEDPTGKTAYAVIPPPKLPQLRCVLQL